MTENFSIEGQLKSAFLSFNRQDGIAHDGGYTGFVTVSAGARYYWNGSSAKHPIFTNLTVGGGGWFEEEYNADNALINKNAILLDVGSGTFIAIKSEIIAGLAIDVLVPANEEGGFMLSAKVGYRF